MNKIIIVILTILTFTMGQDCGKVMYFVDSSKPGISITYENESGNTEQRTASAKMWTYSFEACVGDFVYLSAQTKNANATVKVKIIFTALHRWETIEKAESYGDYVISTASGVIPENN